MNALVYVDIDQGIHKGKSEVARNEKWKNYVGFLYYKNMQILKHFARALSWAQISYF